MGRAIKLSPERIQDDAAFAEYGVDSIVAVALANSLNQSLGLSMSATVIFDHGSVERLAKHVAGLFSAASTTARAPEEYGGRTRRSLRQASPDEPQEPAVITSARESWRAVSPQPGRYLRALIGRPGTIEDLRVISAELPELAADEVLIGVRAFSLNFGDLLCVRGLYPTMPPYPFTPGVEASGIVCAVGAQVRSVRVGEPVIALSSERLGAHATGFVCSERQVLQLPERLSFQEACALPAVALTTIAALRKAQLQSGERILIQTAAGGVGLVAVQLAQHRGAEIFATAGSAQKLDYLR
ncbi:MAG: phosphopantetheine-binding protein, partial [Steroidobacteraceae bacterium]